MPLVGDRVVSIQLDYGDSEVVGDTREYIKGVFTFPNLSVRQEGRYRLRKDLFEIVRDECFHHGTVYTMPFRTFTPKEFPGMQLAITEVNRDRVRISRNIRFKSIISSRSMRARELAGYTNPVRLATGHKGKFSGRYIEEIKSGETRRALEKPNTLHHLKRYGSSPIQRTSGFTCSQEVLKHRQGVSQDIFHPPPSIANRIVNIEENPGLHNEVKPLPTEKEMSVNMEIETKEAHDERSITESEPQKTIQLEMDTNYPPKLPYRDGCMYVDFSMDCPFSVSQIIIDNSSLLSEYVLPLKGNYLFEAGFDIVPAHCRLALPEQSYCFQGI
jgi:hypothetical protein